MDPEDESSNIEYKRHLSTVLENKKIAQLSAQMSRRISNGISLHNKSEAIYYLGVNDNGTIANISKKKMDDSIQSLKQVATYNGAVTQIDHDHIQENVTKVYVRKARQDQNDVRILFLGAEQSGKTTLMGVLINDINDDGQGFARKSIFKYKRELVKGYTTSIREELISYNGANRIYYDEMFTNVYDLLNISTKVVTLIDTPGKPKYSKITYGSIFSYKPDHIYIVYDPCTNIQNLTKYADIAQTLEIPFTIIITKKDLISNINLDINYKVIHVSSKTKENIDVLNNDIYNIEKLKRGPSGNNNVQYIINDMIQNNNYGIIVNGVVTKGTITNNDRLLIGPYKNEFSDLVVKTIHKKQIPCNQLDEYDDGSMLIEVSNIKLNKRMTIFSYCCLSDLVSTFYFKLLDKSINIEKNMKLMIFVSNLYEKVYVDKIISINGSYVYKCHIHKHRKRLIKDEKYIGIKSNDDIIIAQLFYEI